ncbi:hypothetical protein EDD86DRAFT_210869 [Gorgonomyces haynaldii]|nr:hypothetical protein EDD86DRAFT_210869 [Gorgonomyces haynaldii]
MNNVDTRKMSAEQLKQYKLSLLRPHRTRNFAVAGGLFAFCLGIYYVSMRKTASDDFDQ